jgi:3-oxo-5-alpha-steroid 4-dehydrogenase 3
MSDVIATSLQGIPPSEICQTFFGLSSALIGLIQAMPADLRGALMDYGARRPQDGVAGGETQTDAGQKKASSFGSTIQAVKGMLAKLTNYGQVPHSWFLHFYILSTSWSAFWAWQFLTKGAVMGSLARMQQQNGQASTELGQVVLAWALMALQGSRRLYESIYVSKPGKTPMWFVHWALGLCYYTAMGTSVWIEGSSKS